MKKLALGIGFLLAAGTAVAQGKPVYFIAEKCVPVKDKSVDSAYARLTSEWGERLKTVMPPTTVPGRGRYFIAVGTTSDGEELLFPVTDSLQWCKEMITERDRKPKAAEKAVPVPERRQLGKDATAEIVASALGLEGLVTRPESFSAVHGVRCNKYGERSSCNKITDGDVCRRASSGLLAGCEIDLVLRSDRGDQFQCINVSSSAGARRQASMPPDDRIFALVQRIRSLHGEPALRDYNVMSIRYQDLTWQAQEMEIRLSLFSGSDYQGAPANGLSFSICDPEMNVRR